MRNRQPAESGPSTEPRDTDGRIEHPRLRIAEERATPESPGVPEREVAERRDDPRDPDVMRQEDESQVVADRTRVARICEVDAGTHAVDNKRLWVPDQPAETNARK